MEKVISFLLTLLISFCLNAGLSKPFPEGYAMGNLGTIFYEKSPAEFNPFSPAVFLTDSLFLGGSLSYINYYDDMDNYQDFSIYSLDIGMFTSVKNFGFKVGVSEFNFSGIYKEQYGTLSAAISLFKKIKIGIDFSGTRFLLNSAGANEWFTLADIGFSTRINFFSIYSTIKIEHIFKKYWRTDKNPTPPALLTLGFHKKYSKIGAQGIIFKITPDYEKPFSFATGMEFHLLDPLKIQCAINENPFFIAFGITFSIKNGSTSFSLVNHPVLGWSRGIDLQYYKYLQ